MAESFLTDEELKEFRDRIQATYNMGEKYNAKLNHPGNIYYFDPLDVILALYSERLDKSSKRLAYLTWALIGLTFVLAILTGISVWKLFYP